MKTSLFLSFFIFTSISQAQVLAKVGQREITTKDFEEKYKLLKEQMLEAPDRRTLLNDMISFEVGVQEAQKRNLDKDPIVRDRMLQELYKGFVERELAPKTAKITVNEKEMSAYYTQNPEIRVSHIMIEIRPDATAEQRKEARKRAQDIYASVKGSNRPFEDLVKIYSDDMMTNKSGGDIGWQTRLTHYPSLYNAAIRLRVGEISPLIETPYGIFILKLTGKKAYSQADRAMIRLAVQEEKKKKLFDQFINGLRSKYPIKIYKNNL